MTEASPLASLLHLLTSGRLLGVIAIGVPFGLILGIVPGIGGRFGLVMAIPFIFGMDAVEAAVLLISMHSVVHTGGSLPSILVGIGSGPDAATVVDGYPMALRGEAGRAIGASLASSALGGVIGAAALAAGLPVGWALLLGFGPSETFLISALGITFIAALSRTDLLKGLSVGCLGLMLSFVGTDSQLGVPRFTFGQTFLWDGIGVMAVMPALFAVPEMVDLALGRTAASQTSGNWANIGYRQMAEGVADVFRHRWLAIRTSVLGVLVGIVPGLGGDVATWVCYGHAVQTSKHPERFGHGAVEGLIAPDAANNSKEGGSLLPTLLFGIPGSTSMTLLLGALVAVGIQPGAALLFGRGDLLWTLIWTLVVANLVGALMLAVLGRWMGLVGAVPTGQLVPFAFVFIVISALFGSGDVRVLLVLAVLSALGMAFRQADWPRAPFAIGIVLGAVTERALHQAWALWGAAFLVRPGALVLLSLMAASIVFHLVRSARVRRRGPAAGGAAVRVGHAAEATTRPESKPLSGPRTDAWLSALLLALFTAMTAAATRYPNPAGIFPLIVGAAGSVLAAVLLVRHVVAARATPQESAAVSLRPHLAMYLWMLAAIGLVAIGGILAGAAVFTTLFLRLRERRPLLSSVLAAVSLPLVLYVVIDRGFGLPLYQGLWQ